MDKSAPITRRAAIARSFAAIALANCGRKSRPRGPSAAARVSIVRATGYQNELAVTLRRIIAEHRLDVRGKHVVLKPNLVEFDRATVINTHPAVVYAALEAFTAASAASVRIAEAPGHRRVTWELAEAAGYFHTVPRFESLFTDLNLDEVSKVTIAQPFSRLSSLYLPNTALGCDLLVSMPKMKTHHWAGATLSMKNCFGLVPGGVYGWPKNVLHWAGIHESIADIHGLFPRVFSIVDGIVGMEGNGPIQGTPKHVGVLVAGSDLPAVDATCCRIMRIQPEKIGYLQLAAPARLAESDIQQIGEPIASVRTRFALIPEFQEIGS